MAVTLTSLQLLNVGAAEGWSPTVMLPRAGAESSWLASLLVPGATLTPEAPTPLFLLQPILAQCLWPSCMRLKQGDQETTAQPRRVCFRTCSHQEGLTMGLPWGGKS